MATPPLRVSRPVSACARCRNAKIRCDGKLPTCSACERAGKVAECSSANDQFAKGKERSYVASLESRIERLEKQLVEFRNSKGMISPSSSAGRAVGAPKKSQKNEASDVDELVSDFGYLSVNATASGYYGFTKEMSFARLVLSTASVNDMLVPSNSPLPPRDFATHLARDFIRKVSTLYPVLSETAVFGSLEAVYQHKGLYCSPWDRWVVRMVLAIALLLRSQLKGDSDYKNAVLHACAALEQREAIIQPGSMAAIQAILLLVIYSLLDPSHFNSWYLVGVASRIMVDIGLHQEPPEEIRMKSSQLELRRRIFYCLYSLDRAISISHVRALSFTDDSVHVEHPSVSNTPSLTYGAFSSSQYGPPDQAIQPSLDLINFRQVQSPLYHALFGSNRDLLDDPWYRRCDTLHTLKAAIMNIPDATPEEVKQMFNADLHYTSILFVKPPGGKEIICSYGTALLFEYSIGYAQSMWLMYHHSQGSTFCTNLDLIRTMFVAQELLDLLREFRTTLMTSTRPTPPAVDPGVVLPQLQPRSSHEVLAKAIDALTQLDQIIDILGRKFGYPSAYNKFKRESTVILQNLYANDVSSF